MIVACENQRGHSVSRLAFNNSDLSLSLGLHLSLLIFSWHWLSSLESIEPDLYTVKISYDNVRIKHNKCRNISIKNFSYKNIYYRLKAFSTAYIFANKSNFLYIKNRVMIYTVQSLSSKTDFLWPY